MVLNLEGMNSNFSPNISRRLFHFVANWLDHVDFNKFVNTTWNNLHSLHDNLNNLISKVKEWIKVTFGNIFYKKCLKTHLKDIQVAQENYFFH